MSVASSDSVSIVNQPANIEKGQRSCRSATKQFFPDAMWVGSNLPGDLRTDCLCLAHHLMRVLDMLDLESFDGTSLDVWQEIFDEVNDALQGNPASNELAALAATVQQHQVPHELILDPLHAADGWICERRHRTFEDVAKFAMQIGGSTLAAAAIVAGVARPDFEAKAFRAGQAIMLTRLLASTVQDARQGRVFLAEQDFAECEVEVHRLKMRQTGKPITWLVRLYASRIEKMFLEGGQLLEHLDFDASRSFKSLLTMHWRMLRRLQLEPDLIMQPQSVMSRNDMFRLKTRHLLGLEGNAAIFPAVATHH